MLREATKFTDGEPKEYVRVTGSRAAGQTSENRSAVQALKRPGKSSPGRGERSLMLEQIPLQWTSKKWSLSSLFLPVSLHTCVLVRFSPVWLLATYAQQAHQAPLSMGFSRQESCSGLPFPPPGDLPNSGIKPISLCVLHWQAGSLPLEPRVKPFVRS